MIPKCQPGLLEEWGLSSHDLGKAHGEAKGRSGVMFYIHTMYE